MKTTIIWWNRSAFRTNRCPHCGEELMDDFGNPLDGKVDVYVHDTYSGDILYCRRCGLKMVRVSEVSS